mmetsp:Transcript_35060/g.74781  ORF Transcript_35060/g.74781 Transcript_35060/m.74781 type:complete len:299 (-) Transcript_35060:161-1057(-)
MRSSLKGREYSLVNLVLEPPLVLAEEDHTRSRPAETLVCRGGHDITELERRCLLVGRDQSRNVRHVHQEEGAVGVGDLAKPLVVPVSGVGRATANYHGRLEEARIPRQLVVVDDARHGIHLVGEGFEVDRRSAHGLAGVLLLGVGVEPVREMTSGGKVEPHDAIVRREKGGVHSEVGGTAGVGLDVNPPLLRIQSIRLEGALLAELLDLVNDFVSTIVPGVGEALGVFVRQRRAEAFHDRAGGEVLGRDELERRVLAKLLLLDEVMEFGVMFTEGFEPREFLILKTRHGCTFVGGVWH